MFQLMEKHWLLVIVRLSQIIGILPCSLSLSRKDGGASIKQNFLRQPNLDKKVEKYNSNKIQSRKNKNIPWYDNSFNINSAKDSGDIVKKRLTYSPELKAWCIFCRLFYLVSVLEYTQMSAMSFSYLEASRLQAAIIVSIMACSFIFYPLEVLLLPFNFRNYILLTNKLFAMENYTRTWPRHTKNKIFSGFTKAYTIAVVFSMLSYTIVTALYCAGVLSIMLLILYFNFFVCIFVLTIHIRGSCMTLCRAVTRCRWRLLSDRNNITHLNQQIEQVCT